ncbi:MAG: helix-turn-helix domain-containing protein, partial [Flavobacteriales bacterium]
MSLNRQLLKNIRSIRTQKGLNQKELGQRIGMTQASYARFESGARKTDFETLEKVAEVLGVDVCT